MASTTRLSDRAAISTVTAVGASVHGRFTGSRGQTDADASTGILLQPRRRASRGRYK